MTFPLAGLGAPTAAPAAQDRTQLGRDQFLSLLVTQLRYQDPLSPLEPDAFAAQLAQFSTVEQLTQLNKSFEAQLGEQMRGALLTKTSLGASLIGRHVLAEGNEIQVASNGPVSLPVEVASGGGVATVRFLDASGRVVATKPIGQVAGGVQTLDLSPGLPAGTYRYFVDVQGADGQTVGVTTYMDGIVDSVLFENGVIMLRMGNRKVALDLLSEITS
jgi:flagellar basal-body rod modification protein FlgD